MAAVLPLVPLTTLKSVQLVRQYPTTLAVLLLPPSAQITRKIILTIIPILRRQRRIRHDIPIIRRHEVDEKLRRSFHGRVPGCEERGVAGEAVVLHYVEHEPAVGKQTGC